MKALDPVLLSFPAPIRCSEPSMYGYTTHPWDIEDIKFAKSAGAWFSPSAGHQFKTMAAKRFAFGITVPPN